MTIKTRLSDLLAASPVWKDFVQESDESGAIVLRHVRSEGDHSEDLILRYRAKEGGPILVNLAFSRLDEEQANEGMYEMYRRASNCIHWICESIGRGV